VALVNPALLVGVGGVAGAIARHLLGERIDEHAAYGTVDTLAVNVIGSLLLGGILAAPPTLIGTELQLLLGTGFCGAFTTFSTFAFETVRLVETGDRVGAALSALANLGGAIAAVVLGAGLVAVLT
jgi:CrcB protein